MSDKKSIVVIACQVFEEMLARALPPDLVSQVTYLDYGLHRTPNKIVASVQRLLDEIETPSLVILGYGLCGNGITGIQARHHTLLVPRADDCITMLLGSRQRYYQEFEAEPGTYWLSKGWLESGSHPLKEYEEYREKYGEEDALWLLDQQYQHYKRLVLVAHSRDDLEHYRPQAEAVAQFCQRWNMHYEEILGSDQFIQKLVQVAQDLEKADSEFVIIPPGGEIRLDQFMP